jgi:Mg-chelatase subunit ChlD
LTDTTDETIDETLDAIQTKLDQTPVLCGVVIDRSGSMIGLTKNTIDGFNEFLQEQKRVAGKMLLHLTLFDTTVEARPAEDVQQVAELTDKTYVCNGMTALYDAVGVTIGELEKTKQATGAKKVVLCVITDGMENSSKEYDGSKVREMVKDRENDNWDVLFLGAGLDVAAQAQNMGVAAQSSARYMGTASGTQTLHNTVSDYVTRSRTTHKSTSNILTDEERDALANPDA